MLSPPQVDPVPLISSPLTCSSPLAPLGLLKPNTSPVTIPSTPQLGPNPVPGVRASPVTLAPSCFRDISMGPPVPMATPLLPKVPTHTPVTSTVTSVRSIQSDFAQAEPSRDIAMSSSSSFDNFMRHQGLMASGPQVGDLFQAPYEVRLSGLHCGRD